jgi:hypothetical protein
MIARTLVISLLMPLVLVGNSAGAGTRTDPAPASRRLLAPPTHQHTTVNVYGCNNVIAMDGSVMSVGGSSRLNANTGDVSSSGTLGIDTERSSLRSGTATWRASSRLAGSPVQASGAEPPAPNGSPFPIPVSGQSQGTAISGYEDHSVHVTGEDQRATYDDSNLFVDRNGQLNANTGDTDSSGLNAVDVSNSTVGSGTHTEDDESNDDEEGAGMRRAGRPAATTGSRPGSNDQASSTVTDEGESRTNGESALTIGADGYDDLALDVHGRRNIATYDDSNVVVGGTGDVNAQIGDSDTSGAVVMGIDDSDVRAGDST